MFALSPNLSKVWAIVYVICLFSLVLCANLCVTCGILYVVCSVLHATCPESIRVVFKNPFERFIHNMGKNGMLYLQNHSLTMWHWQNYMWHRQIRLSTFTIELFLDMTLAWDPTFIKYIYLMN